MRGSNKNRPTHSEQVGVGWGGVERGGRDARPSGFRVPWRLQVLHAARAKAGVCPGCTQAPAQ